VTPKEAQKVLYCADTLALLLNWEKAPESARREYRWLVRLCVKYGAK
jgi:hypothetical protein